MIIKEENTAVVEFVQLLSVQVAQLFPLTDVSLTHLWQKRLASIFSEKVPANSHAGIIQPLSEGDRVKTSTYSP